MLERLTNYFKIPFYRHIAQADNLSSSQVTSVPNLAIYRCFLAKLDNVSKIARTYVSIIELFNIVSNFKDYELTFWDKLTKKIKFSF